MLTRSCRPKAKALEPMRASEKNALIASVLAAVVVIVVGTALSIVLGSFARGFVVLGASSLIAASMVLWRPFASGLLKEPRSSQSLRAVDTAHRKRRRRSGKRAARGRNLMVLLLGLLIGLATAVPSGWVDGLVGSHSNSPDSIVRSIRGDGERAPWIHNRREAPREEVSPKEEAESYQFERSPETPSAGGASEPPAAAGGTPSSGSEFREGSPNTSSVASSGRSSPLVPILIAIAVLAALSIGGVMYRQRRLGGHTPAGEPRH